MSMASNDWDSVTTVGREVGRKLSKNGLTEGLTCKEAGALAELGFDPLAIATMPRARARNVIFEFASAGFLSPYDWFSEKRAEEIETRLVALQDANPDGSEECPEIDPRT
jgi:hypothetical protein